jgi:lipid-A-disaccharide synthase
LKRYFIVAGEPSGDMHGARLINSMKRINPNIEFVGIGGPAMAMEGLDSIVPMEKISVVGMWEVAKRIIFFRNLLSECRKILTQTKFDAFIPIDFPGFNLKLSEFAHKINIPVIYYIAPQLWAWGKKRAIKMQKIVDQLLVVFPFEEEFFTNHKINTTFVGHPLLDDPTIPDNFPEFKDRQNNIVIFPGSRKQELSRHSQLIIDISKEINQKLPDYSISLAKAKSLDLKEYELIKRNIPNIHFDFNNRKMMLNAKAGIIKTGTSNLEAALCGLPFSMFYKTSALSYWITRNLVDIKYLSLINILTNKPIIHEFIQWEANSKAIVEDLIGILQNPQRYREIQDNYRTIKNLLGNKGASDIAASKIVELT